MAVVIASLTLVGSACSSSSTPSPDQAIVVDGALELVAPKTFADRIGEGSPVIIDVRTAEEFAAGHIAGAQLIDISSSDFKSRVEALDRAGTYFVYCRSGNRSAAATALMVDLGFSSLVELDGGVLAWGSEGFPLTK